MKIISQKQKDPDASLGESYATSKSSKSKHRDSSDKSGDMEFFKPSINSYSKLLITDDPEVPRHELLIKYQQDKEKKLLQLRLEKLNSELDSCTFNPVILRGPKRTVGYSASERLYQHRNIPKGVCEPRTTADKELEECTFQPFIEKPKVPKPQTEAPRGYQETVQRMRQAIKEKQERKDLEEKIPCGENYEKLKQQKVKPFSFLERERRRDRQVLIYLDVTVAPGKMGRIAIHDDDDPRELARNFCRSFNLTADKEETLESMIMDYKQGMTN